MTSLISNPPARTVAYSAAWSPRPCRGPGSGRPVGGSREYAYPDDYRRRRSRACRCATGTGGAPGLPRYRPRASAKWSKISGAIGRDLARGVDTGEVTRHIHLDKRVVLMILLLHVELWLICLDQRDSRISASNSEPTTRISRSRTVSSKLSILRL